MPSVSELTAVYSNFMRAPRPGPGVCEICFNLTNDYDRCYACTQMPQVLDLIAPISYSIAGEQLHHALYGYKRLGGDIARRFTVELAAVLWRYTAVHERCIARAAGLDSTAERFEIITTVPSSDRERDAHQPLRTIVGELAAPTRDRYERLLERSAQSVTSRRFEAAKYTAAGTLEGASVLLIDDTWTTGASAQSAAQALKSAGAGPVAALVIGRHINREWGDNDARLRAAPPVFDWESCPFCTGS